MHANHTHDNSNKQLHHKHTQVFSAVGFIDMEVVASVAHSSIFIEASLTWPKGVNIIRDMELLRLGNPCMDKTGRFRLGHGTLTTLLKQSKSNQINEHRIKLALTRLCLSTHKWVV